MRTSRWQRSLLTFTLAYFTSVFINSQAELAGDRWFTERSRTINWNTKYGRFKTNAYVNVKVTDWVYSQSPIDILCSSGFTMTSLIFNELFKPYNFLENWSVFLYRCSQVIRQSKDTKRFLVWFLMKICNDFNITWKPINDHLHGQSLHSESIYEQLKTVRKIIGWTEVASPRSSQLRDMWRWRG